MVEMIEFFNQPGAGFVLLPVGLKFPPIHDGWQLPENAHTFAEAQAHVAKGGNVGSLAGNGFIGLDQDDPNAFMGLDLPTATTWETRPGRCGMRFKCSDVTPELLVQYGKKADLAQFHLYKDGVHVGEIKLQKSYQTIPPSHKFIDPITGDDVLPGKGDKVDYKLIDTSPPAEISLAKLLADLRRIGITFSGKPKTSRLEANAAKLEDISRKAHQRRAESEETRTVRYAKVALRDEVLTLAGTPAGNRNEQLNKSAFALGQFVGAGLLSEGEVISELSGAAGNTGLDSDEIRKTILSGLVAGRQHPREIPEQSTTDTGPKDIEPHHITREDVCNIDYGENGKEKSCKLSPTRAGGSIEKYLKLAMTKDDNSIYYFDNGIYHPDGERIVDMTLCNVAGDAVDVRKLKEVLRRIRNDLLSEPVTFDPNPYLLGVKNGVVDLSTGTFREYRPEDLITDQIDVTYDEAAKCPWFIQFLEEVVPVVVDRLMLVDWFAIHAIRLMFAYVMFLLGLGRNGKGIFERLMKRFYKEESFSEMPLEELNVKNNWFAGAALKGKRGQIVSEAGEERKPGSKRTIPTNYLKFSTGDGTIDSDQKGTIRTRFKPFYKATIDCNDMPFIGDSSAGWIERFCKANMPFKFVDNPTPGTLERKKDPHLFEKLTTDCELSGILNLILSRTPDLIRTKTIIKRSGAEMFAEYQKQSSSVNTFLEMFCDYKPVSDKSKDTFIDLIFEKYEAWCDSIVADKVDDKRFGKAVKTFCKGTESERVLDGDKKRRIYHGLSFDINRYQSLMDHYNTIKRPLKRVSGPLGPLNDVTKYDVMLGEMVEKYGVNKYETKNSSFLASMDPIAITKIDNGPDSVFNGLENQINSPISFCAKCGEDLTGHGVVEHGGKSYCARPGCGYPIREEAKAN